MRRDECPCVIRGRDRARFTEGPRALFFGTAAALRFGSGGMYVRTYAVLLLLISTYIMRVFGRWWVMSS